MPNNIFIQADIKIPGRLIINQNFDKNWKADKGEISEYNGLISLQLNDTGKKIVRLIYFPKIFLVGLAISVISLFAAGFALTRIR